MKIKLSSIITCPNCKYAKEEIMPTDSCQYFYECNNCKAILSSNPKEIFTIEEIPDFTWQPLLQNTFIKTDVLNKQKQKCN